VDKSFQRAVDAGAKVAMPLADQFWGDRYGSLADPFGYVWGLGTHKEDLNPQQMQERMKNFFAQMAQRKSA
jgi:PhnB protein